MSIDYGKVICNGTTITLTEQAYINNYGTDCDVRYYAHGVDTEGNEYLVAWELTPERQEEQQRHRLERHGETACDCNDDESNACDWDDPVDVKPI